MSGGNTGSYAVITHKLFLYSIGAKIVRLDVRTNSWTSSKVGLCIQKKIKSEP